jgi:hypothetical protein
MNTEWLRSTFKAVSRVRLGIKMGLFSRSAAHSAKSTPALHYEQDGMSRSHMLQFNWLSLW